MAWPSFWTSRGPSWRRTSAAWSSPSAMSSVALFSSPSSAIGAHPFLDDVGDRLRIRLCNIARLLDLDRVMVDLDLGVFAFLAFAGDGHPARRAGHPLCRVRFCARGRREHGLDRGLDDLQVKEADDGGDHEVTQQILGVGDVFRVLPQGQTGIDLF